MINTAKQVISGYRRSVHEGISASIPDMKGHVPWQLHKENSWSSLKQPQSEKR